jgi:hypothetical protein
MDSVEFDRIAKDRVPNETRPPSSSSTPRVLTEELLRDYLERFMKYVKGDDEEYAKRGFVDVGPGCLSTEGP